MNKKIKISIIGTRGYPYVYSGYETFVKEVSERLVNKNYNVKIYCHKGLFNKRPKAINGIDLVYISTIETKVFIGLGNTVTKNINPGMLAVGSPANEIKESTYIKF